MKDPTEYNVRAVERALQILNCFDDEHPERSLSEIAQGVELHKATTHRIITTLVNYGFLERIPENQKYRLGLQLTDLGLKAVRRMDLRRVALPYMQKLSQELDEACDLSIFDRGDVFYIEFTQGTRALTVAAAVGQRLPPHCTASGKLFLAQLSPDELGKAVKRPMAAFTTKTMTSPDALLRHLEKVRSQGFGMDDEEMEVGIRAVSAPVRDQTGRMVAALSIPGPTSRITDERLPEIVRALVEIATSLSRRLGWNG
jgi:DNA-binding IclR family transcriptional regulator